MNYFTADNTMELILAGLIILILISLIRISRDSSNSMHLTDLITVRGRIDEKKFSRFGAWIDSTWGFIYIIVNNPTQFPEWYFLGYMTVWVSNAIMGKYVSTMNQEDPPQFPGKNL
jgi:hypothetical protein